MTMVLLKLLYPERRQVTEAQVMSWASDSYYNNADYYVCSKCEKPTLTECECEHDGEAVPIYEDGTKPPADLLEAMAWLEDLGEATFGRQV